MRFACVVIRKLSSNSRTRVSSFIIERASNRQTGKTWAVVVAQLIEWFLLLPEVRGSNPVIGKKFIEHSVYC